MQVQTIRPQRPWPISPTPRRGVYVRVRWNVKHLAAALGLACVLTGCAAPRAYPAANPYLVAVRYDVLPRLLSVADDQRHQVLLDDLQAIAGWGFDTLVVTCVPDGDLPAIERVAQEAGLAAAPPTDLGGGNQSTGALAVIDVGLVWSGPPSTAGQRLLHAYHRELLSGRTDGILLDRFARLPQDPTAENELGPRAAVAELLARAKRWGPHLVGARFEAREVVETSTGSVDLVRLSRGRRRFLFLANPSEDRFIRGEATLGLEPRMRSIQRLVELLTSGTQPAGQVLRASGGAVRVPLSLAPGDALLFELFQAE